MNMRRTQRRKLAPILMAVALGAFLAIASEALSWSGTTTFVVGCALTAVLALLGTPLLLLDLDRLDISSTDSRDLAAFRAAAAREIAIQARKLAAQDRAFESIDKVQNFNAPFVSSIAPHNLRALNQASASDFLKELARYQAAHIQLLKEQQHIHLDDVSNPPLLPESEFIDTHEVRHEPESLSVNVADSTTHHIRRHQESLSPRPILEVATQ